MRVARAARGADLRMSSDSAATDGPAHGTPAAAASALAARAGGSGGAERSADLVLLTAITLWSLNYSIIKFGITEIQPLAFPLIRFGLGGIALAAIVRWREGSLRFARRDLPLLLATAVLGITLNQMCFVFALATTSATDVALLGATGPIVTALLATMVGLERPGARHWASVTIGMLGVALIVGGGVGAGSQGATFLGDLLALGAAVFASASALPIRPLMQRYSARRILSFEMLAGAAMLLPFSLPSVAGQDFTAVSAAGWGALVYAAVFSGMLTNILYFTGIDRVGPSRAAVYQYLQSFLGVLFAVVLLSEHVTVLQLIGGLIVIGSVALSRMHPRGRAAMLLAGLRRAGGR